MGCMILLPVLIITLSRVHAQQIRFDRITVADGLGSNSVYSILQDSRGILWFGTLDGLTKYDGYSYTVYRHDVSRKRSISNNRITMIYEDTGGHLWLYDEFTSYLIKCTPMIEEIRSYYLKPIGGPDFEVPQAIYEDGGTLFIQSIKGTTLRYNEPKDTFELEDRSWSLPQDSLASFDQQQMLQAFDRYLKEIHSPYNSSSVQPRKILRSSDGRYWIATKLQGLFSAIRVHNEFRFISHLTTPNKHEKVNSEDVHDVYEDQSNVIWIGTKNAGLFRYARHKYKFDHIETIETEDGTIELGTLRAIVEDAEKNIWVGTNDQGLIRIDQSRKTGKVYKPKASGSSAIGHRFIRSLWIDDHQQLWVGHYGGFSLYKPSIDGFQVFIPKPNHEEEIRVYDIKGDKHHGVWMAAWDLVLHYDLVSKEYKFISQASSGDIGFTIDNIRALQLNDDGNLAIVAGEKGISLFDQSAKKFVTVQYSPSDSTGLPSNNLFDVLKDRSGKIWLATTDGLCLFDPANLSCSTFTVNDGLPSNLIYSILEDQQGYLWFSTTKGIGRLNPETKTFRNYDAADGLQSNEFAENAVFQNEKGFIFFGGINGLNIFHPQDVPESHVPPRVAITNVKVFDKPLSEIKLLSQVEILEKIKSNESIVFNSEQRSISFEFAAYHYVNPQKNRYAYQLKGFDGQWINQDANIRFANYTNLEPGEYTFMVKASNSDGIWSEPVQLSVIIEKPFYSTWWFISLIVIGLLSSGVFAYRWRIAALRKQQSMKAIQLESELNSLKSQVNPHFLFNTLNNIYSLCQVNSRNAAPMVGKISEMMRYMIYDCNAQRVPLQKEIEYLQNYIELNQLKSHRKLNLKLDVTGDVHEHKIAPLLLINFVENGFKHGDVSVNDRGFITIRLTIDETKVTFEMKNSYRELHHGKAIHKGIGIENVKHRLALLYPHKHRLRMERNDNVFTVELVLETDN
jgi:ligand-binding sensor domain-containing protein